MNKVEDRAPTRRRILDAAVLLFDTEGVRGATVDRIAATAGITKRTLYYHFRSKDDLIAAALEDRESSRDGVFDTILDRGELDAAQFVAAAFGQIAARARDIRWKGCAFTRAAAELAGLPGHPGVVAARRYKKEIERGLFERLTRDGVKQADTLARRLVILLEGAIMHGIVHHEPDYALEAGRAAQELIERAQAGPIALTTLLAPALAQPARRRLCLLSDGKDATCTPRR